MQIRHLPSLYVLGKLYNDIAFMEFTWVEGSGVSFCVSFFLYYHIFYSFLLQFKTKKSPPFISKSGQA